MDVLVQKLNGLPLALTQAGAYMKMTGISVQDYVRYYNETWSELMANQDRYPLQEYDERSLLTTWMISFQQAERQSASATSLLKLWSFLSCDGLWHELIAAAQHFDLPHEVPQWLMQMSRSKLKFADAMGVLSAYSLIDRKAHADSYTLHSVLHQWCSSLLTEEEGQRLHLLCYCLVAQIVPEEEESYWIQDRRLLPHVVQLRNRTGNRTGTDDSKFYAWACHVIGGLLARQALLIEAEEMYMRALKGYEKALGAEHTSTLNSVKSLGTLYSVQGKLAEAEEMYMRALKGYEKALGAEHTSTLSTVHSLGILYSVQGKLAEAEEMYTREQQATVVHPAQSIVGRILKATLRICFINKPENTVHGHSPANYYNA